MYEPSRAGAGRRGCCAVAASAGAAPAPTRRRKRSAPTARQQLYNLDRDRALATFREAVAADPDDAGGTSRPRRRALARASRSAAATMTVDDYLGGVVDAERQAAAAPARAASTELRRSPSTGRWRSRAQTHRGQPAGRRRALSSSAPPSACARRTRRRSTAACCGAFRSAREAYDAHETVLELDAAPQGRRPHRRHLPLPRRDAVAADAVDGLRRRVRRRPRKRPDS